MKVIFWYEVVLLAYIFLFIPMLLCSIVTVLLIWRKIHICLTGKSRVLAMFGIMVTHMALSLTLTMSLCFGIGEVVSLIWNTHLIDNFWILISIYFVVSECILIPSYYYFCKWIVNKHNFRQG